MKVGWQWIIGWVCLSIPVLGGAQSFDIRVTGRIVLGTCEVTVGDTGSLDYGKIDLTKLNSGALTVLPAKEMAVRIACPSLTRFALRAVDNRSRGIFSNEERAIASHYPGSYVFSFGEVAGRNIGSYIMQPIAGTFKGDGAKLLNVASVDGGITWRNGNTGNYFTGSNSLLGFALNVGSTPGAYKNVSGRMRVAVVLNAAAIPASNDTPLDGSATFELVYL